MNLDVSIRSFCFKSALLCRSHVLLCLRLECDDGSGWRGGHGGSRLLLRTRPLSLDRAQPLTKEVTVTQVESSPVDARGNPLAGKYHMASVDRGMGRVPCELPVNEILPRVTKVPTGASLVFIMSTTNNRTFSTVKFMGSNTVPVERFVLGGGKAGQSVRLYSTDGVEVGFVYCDIRVAPEGAPEPKARSAPDKVSQRSGDSGSVPKSSAKRRTRRARRRKPRPAKSTAQTLPMSQSGVYIDHDFRTSSGGWMSCSAERATFAISRSDGESTAMAALAAGPAAARMLRTDVVRASGAGYGCSFVEAAGDTALFVALPPLSSWLSDETIRAAGMRADQALVVRLLWRDGAPYMSSCPSAARGTVTVRQTTSLGHCTAIDPQDWGEFGLWWTVEQELSEWLRKAWAKVSADALEAHARSVAETKALDPHVRSILEVFEWPATDAGVAELALQRCNGQLDEAIALLYDDAAEASIRRDLGLSQSSQAQAQAQAQLPLRSTDGTAVAAATTATPTSGATTATAGVTNTLRSLLPRRLQEKAPPLVSGLVEEVQRLIRTASSRCVVCAAPHKVELLKPTVCARDLCSFQSSALGLGTSLTAELRTAPEVVDLLIAFTFAASTNVSRFSPFPLLQRRFRSLDEARLAVSASPTSFHVSDDACVSTSKGRSASGITSIIQSLPTVEFMSSLVAKADGDRLLRQALDARHALAWHLLSWIVASNRAHLTLLPPDRRAPCIDTPYQFLMNSSPPEQERRFQELKAKHGTFFAWHGSSFFNWHAITRVGLKNYSGTNLQSCGAAFGPGIYMSYEGSTSMGYAGGSALWQGSMLGSSSSHVLCIALVEVIDSGSFVCDGNVHRPRCIHNTSSPHIRVANNDYQATRFLFFINGQASMPSATVAHEQLKKSM